MKEKRNHILTEARKKLNLTQGDIAKELGTSFHYVSEIETLDYYPSLEIQEKFSKFFIDRGIYLFPEDLFPKEMYSKNSDYKFINLDEINDNEIPSEENSYVNQIDNEHLSYGVRRILGKLRKDEKIILEANCLEEKSLDEITEEEILGRSLTKERIRQIREKAAREFRNRYFNSKFDEERNWIVQERDYLLF